MKIKVFILLMAVSLQMVYGQKLVSKTGHIWFYSHTPMEDIEAHNNQVASILDVSTGDMVFSMLIKAFKFKRALMEEHFNENYMESDKLPKSAFKGKIANISSIDLKKDGSYPVEVTGDLTIHGVTKPVNVKGTVEVKSGTITAKAKFTVIPKDYNIIIPSLVENKIAKEIEVNVNVSYTK